MLHLIKYNLLIKLRNFNMVFWPLVFPLIMSTFFFLDQVQSGDSELIALHEMSEKDALDALSQKKISGIYYEQAIPGLTLNGQGIPESILQSVLESYENNLHTLQTILKKHPSGLLSALRQMSDTKDLVREVSLGGKTIDGNSQFFYALVAMGCLYGCFIGFGSVITLQANLTALAARRCITPTHKLKLILSEQIASFLLGYADVIVLLLYLRNILNLDFQGQFGKMLIISLFGSLIGVSMGLFIGSLSRLNEGIKIGIMLAISMSCCFLSGLMNGSMKDTVEKHAPIINRFNPAALISDALYCINVYDDASRYYRNLITLIVMSAALVLASFLLIRRERYDSISRILKNFKEKSRNASDISGDLFCNCHRTSGFCPQRASRYF